MDTRWVLRDFLIYLDDNPCDSKFGTITVNQYIKKELKDLHDRVRGARIKYERKISYDKPFSRDLFAKELKQLLDDFSQGLLQWLEGTIFCTQFGSLHRNICQMLLLRVIINELAAKQRTESYRRMLDFFLMDCDILFLNGKQSIFSTRQNHFSFFALSFLSDIEMNAGSTLSYSKSLMLLQIVRKWHCHGLDYVAFLDRSTGLYQETPIAWAKIFMSAHTRYESKGGIDFFLLKQFSDLRVSQSMINSGIDGLRELNRRKQSKRTLAVLGVLLVKIDRLPVNVTEKRECLQVLTRKVSACETVEETLRIYNFYKNATVLTMRRHPIYDEIKEKFNGPCYNSSHALFIEACQEQFTKLADPKETYSLGDLFSAKHQINMHTHFKGLDFLKVIAKSCNSKDEVVKNYNKWKNHEMITTGVAPSLSNYIGRFFNTGYSPFKINFIEAFQEQYRSQSKTETSEEQTDLFDQKHEANMKGRFQGPV